MCVVCGCSDTGSVQMPDGGTTLAAGASVAPAESTNGDLHFGSGPARVSVPGMSQARAIRIEADILGANDRIARENRAHFAAHGVTALNLVSSPGSGKTTLLCASLRLLRERLPDLPLAVIEGDQQTSLDADRIRATGVPAIQVNTGKGCHLDAPMVAAAFARLHAHVHAHAHAHAHDHDHDHDHDHEHPHAYAHAHATAVGAGSLLFIENVGNLVCPALWDLGEAARVVVLSVTEGEDKPRKYPDLFATARLMVLTKVDLLPYVTFDVARCVAMAREVNPGIEVLQVSATTGAGMDDWLTWILALAGQGATTAGPQAAEVAALRARVAELEAELARRQGAATP